MQQNPPPFKRFARERFDGTSLYGQRPVPGGRSHESPSRIPLSDSKHMQPHFQPETGPSVEQNFMDHRTSSSNQSTAPQPQNSSRSREHLQDSHIVSPVIADAPFPWRLRASAGESQPSTSSVRQRRQHAALRNGDGHRGLEARAGIGLAPSYPQLSPYHVADDHVPRSVSQPNTPSFYPRTQQQHLEEPAPLNIVPRSPTYPPASRRRVRSATGTGDSNFTDEEFHLFVQATAGLGPEQSYRNPNSPHNPLDGEETRTRSEFVARSDLNTISPEQGTPTTAWALQQMAQMPYGTYVPQQQDGVYTPPIRRRLEPSSSELDLWLQPPSATSDDNYDVSPIEDELPDYASSQAQAQAEQRIEAARRAQELQRRWRESHS